MVVAFLRSKNANCSMTQQQMYLTEYAINHHLIIDRFEIDNSFATAEFEDRSEFSDMLKSLEDKQTTLLVYDTLSLSSKTGELAKIFQCILKRSITLHLHYEDVIVDSNFPILMLLEIFTKQREKIKEMTENHSKLGRPSGSLSKSKFDKLQDEIILKLIEKKAVTKIALELSVSRSSLKDYINSRNLKEIAIIKANESETLLSHNYVALPIRKCDLLDALNPTTRTTE